MKRELVFKEDGQGRRKLGPSYYIMASYIPIPIVHDACLKFRVRSGDQNAWKWPFRSIMF